MVGGIGAGKTKLLAILATMLSYENPPGVPGMVVAPTYPMLRDIDATALEEFWVEHGIPFVPRRQEHTYHLPECGNLVMLRSCDNPDRLRGPNLGWAIGDEIAQWEDSEEVPQRSAVNILLGRLRHPRARRHLFAVVGTPNGFDHLYARFAEPGGKRRLPDAWYTTAPTWENTYLRREFVSSLEGTYDAQLYRQEVAGEFVAVGQSATYYAFSRDRNLRAFEVEPNLPLALCCDFNVAGVWEVAQYDNAGVVRVVDEIAFASENSTTIAAREFMARYGGHPAGIEVYADRTGKSKSTTGLSDFHTIAEIVSVWPSARHGGNPPVIDRIAAVNRKLLDARGKVSLYVHPEKCPRLVKDFEQCRNVPGTRQPDKTNPALTHASDALGYMVHDLWPIVANWRAA